MTDPLSSRRSCPWCRCPGAELLFNVTRCRSDSCRYFDPTLASVEDERTSNHIASWFAARAREDGKR